MKYVRLVILFVLVVIAIGIAMVRKIPQQPSGDGKLTVTASFYPLAEFARHVGGDLVSVTTLTPAGSEPHDFDPSPRDIAAMQSSRVFLYNGTGLEPWVTKILPDLQNQGVRILNATDGLPLIPSDPHVWLSPALAQLQVRAIAAALAASDSTHAAQYEQNADAYVAQLEQLHRDFANGTRECRSRDIVTSHAAFAYLAREYRLNMVPIAGLSPDEEPSPARLAEISTFVKERGVTHIFFETLVSPALSETIAHETGATTVALHPLEGLTDEEIAEGKTYISLQRENLATLRTALRCL